MFTNLLDCLLKASSLIWNCHFLKLTNILGFDLGELCLEFFVKDYTLIHTDN